MDLTSEQWLLVQPLLPPPSTALRGRPPIDERRVLDGILWKVRNGAPWYDLPPAYPSFQTCYRRYHQWQRDGILDAILTALYEDLCSRGGLDLLKAVRQQSIVSRGRGRRLAIRAAPHLLDTWQFSTACIFIRLAIKRSNYH